MDKITYRLVYNRRKILNMRGQALVQVEAYLKGSKRYFSTNVYLRLCMESSWYSPHRF